MKKNRNITYRICESFFVHGQSTKFAKGKISQRFDKNLEEIYLIKHFLQKENVLSCGDYDVERVSKDTRYQSIWTPASQQTFSCSKFFYHTFFYSIIYFEQINVTCVSKNHFAECSENKPIEIDSVCSNNFDVERNRCKSFNKWVQMGSKSWKLFWLIIMIIKVKNVSESTHTIKICVTIHQWHLNQG